MPSTDAPQGRRWSPLQVALLLLVMALLFVGVALSTAGYGVGDWLTRGAWVPILVLNLTWWRAGDRKS